MNELIKRGFGDFAPDFFKTDNLFKFNREFEKILNGRSDFEEDNDKYTVELEIPGVKKEEVEITLKNDVLTIGWSRKKENKKTFGKSIYERAEGSFSRSFDVEGADSKKIEAELKNGVLKVVVAKREDFKPFSIKIN
ncbi:MAG TPA: Hsp20/alpha crystallin family protein [Spirochaetota bacterium]|nr:Hsp20/alpha crystallin family protein [Spirochaetota bacterium]